MASPSDPGTEDIKPESSLSSDPPSQLQGTIVLLPTLVTPLSAPTIVTPLSALASVAGQPVSSARRCISFSDFPDSPESTQIKGQWNHIVSIFIV